MKANIRKTGAPLAPRRAARPTPEGGRKGNKTKQRTASVLVEHETASVLVEQNKINDTSPAPAGMIDSSDGFTPMGNCEVGNGKWQTIKKIH